MKSDFSRISFAAGRQYTSLLHQQGRAQTDADFNEQSAIHAHFREALASSLTGTDGAIFLSPSVVKPLETPNLPGFRLVQFAQIDQVRTDVKRAGTADGTAADRRIAVAATEALSAFKGHNCWISPGHYYADGLRCENDAWVPLDAQPFLPPGTETLPEKPAEPENPELRPVILFFLDAWERPVSWLDEPSISDVALGAGVDTSMRSRLIWQVRSLSGYLNRQNPDGNETGGGRGDVIEENPFLARLPWLRHQPRLRVRIKPGNAANDPCRPAFASAWRGLENQLYRVEIHAAADGELPTFKWSRENGSVVARVSGLEGSHVRVFPAQLKGGGFRPGDWLEIVRKDDELTATPGDMVRVASVHGDSIVLEKSDGGAVPAKGDKLRRWDQHSCDSGVLPVTYGWIDIENGIQVCFMPAEGDPPLSQEGAVSPRVTDPDYDKKIYEATDFRSSDWWGFTARTATAGVDWPDEPVAETTIDADVSAQFAGTDLQRVLFGAPVPVRINGQAPVSAEPRVPAALPPHGVRHRYALLATAMWQSGTDNQQPTWQLDDIRRILKLCEVEAEFRRAGVEAPTTAEPEKPQVVVNPGRETLVAVLADSARVKATAIVANKAVAVERRQLEISRNALTAVPKITKLKSKKTTENPK